MQKDDQCKCWPISFCIIFVVIIDASMKVVREWEIERGKEREMGKWMSNHTRVIIINEPGGPNLVINHIIVCVDWRCAKCKCDAQVTSRSRMSPERRAVMTRDGGPTSSGAPSFNCGQVCFRCPPYAPFASYLRSSDAPIVSLVNSLRHPNQRVNARKR